MTWCHVFIQNTLSNDCKPFVDPLDMLSMSPLSRNQSTNQALLYYAPLQYFLSRILEAWHILSHVSLLVF